MLRVSLPLLDNPFVLGLPLLLMVGVVVETRLGGRIVGSVGIFMVIALQ